jgi:F-type H+-transporting ATPase subunit gamma
MTWEQTRRQRQAVDTIHDIVSAMRSVAAGRIQGAQRALAAARRYHDGVLRALAMVLGQAPPPTESSGGPTTLVVLTSEQPLCGPFNQQVLELAERRWHELRVTGEVYLVAVGHRGIRQWLTRGITPNASEAAATSLYGLRDLVKRLAGLLSRRQVEAGAGEVRVIWSRYHSVTEQIPTEDKILPPDRMHLAARAAPVPSRFHRYLPTDKLLAGVIHEYVFISLYRIAADSFASEQASRLVAMDAATHNAERRQQTLLELERRERQDEITRQVLELIGARFTPASGGC